VTFTPKKYLLKEDLSSVALVSFRAMASQLSGFREKRILRDYDAKLTPKTKLEGKDLFFCCFTQNFFVMGCPNSINLTQGTFWRVQLHRTV
jgi:hypothetical protein